jgi:FAM192A/Fyv6, N-terminal domain
VGLFEQLRQNQEEEEAAREEFQRSIMRGTLALDDDDAAHLQQLQAQKQAARSAQEQQTAEQLASFRTAQAERSLQRSGGGPVEQESMPQSQATTFMADSIPISANLLPVESPFSNSLTTAASTAAGILSSNMIPVTIKRRKRRPTEPTADTTKTSAIEQRPESNVSSCTSKRAKGNTAATTTSAAPVTGKDGRLSSLLAGYSSSSSSSDT